MIRLLERLGLPHRAVARVKERLPEATYIELVQSLYQAIAPAVIMTACFASAGAYILHRSGDTILAVIYGLGLVTSMLRLGVLLGLRDKARDPNIGHQDARSVERRFGLGYVSFAAALGAFAARAYWVGEADLHILLVALIYGYAAGVAATVSLRLWISVPAILLAVVPMIGTSLALPGATNWGTGLLTILFLAGGIGSMFQRYADTSAQITMRRLMETLARQDSLTGLPNRLALREKFDDFVSRSDGATLIAVHCVDINQLEPVNEMYGHMAGDQLLKAVAQRLRRVVRGDNLVIHLNGDDFVIVQPDITAIAEAEALARQIVATLDKNYAVAGEDIIITANLGYAVELQHQADLERLLLGAERALNSGKRQASGIAGYDATRWRPRTAA